MTSPQAESANDWRIVDFNEGYPIEVKQVNANTFYLRSATRILILDAEGFNKYREGDEDAFQDYLAEKGIQSLARTALHD